jgi:hypothetical protein
MCHFKSNSVIYLLFVTFLFQVVAACSQNAQLEMTETISTIENTEEVFTQTPIPALIPSASPKPLPTLSVPEKLDRASELQKTNGGCNLPCWWDITPGITNWEEVARKLVPIASKDITFTIDNNRRMHYLEFPSVSRDIIADIFIQKNGVVDVIRTGWDYSIINFLREYGVPKEVWISSDGIVPGPSLFRIVIFYPERGIMAAYIGQSKLISRHGIDYISICAKDLHSSGPLWLWASDTGKQFEELPIENLTGQSPTSLKFKRIGEYTNLKETNFYSSMLKDAKSTCLETKADIWPNPDLYTTPRP